MKLTYPTIYVGPVVGHLDANASPEAETLALRLDDLAERGSRLEYAHVLAVLCQHCPEILAVVLDAHEAA
jgi:hypothetical protein